MGDFSINNTSTVLSFYQINGDGFIYPKVYFQKKTRRLLRCRVFIEKHEKEGFYTSFCSGKPQ